MIYTTASAAPASARRSGYAPALRSLDRFLEQAIAGSRMPAGAEFTQGEGEWTLALDVPGVARDQLAIAIEAATVKIESVEGAPRRYRMAFELAAPIDAAASRAKLEHGVLTLTLVKAQPKDTATKLAID